MADRATPRSAPGPTPPAARAIPARAGWRRAAAGRPDMAVEQAVGHIGRAQLAGHPDIVVGARAVAAQRQFRRHGAEHGHADGEVMRAAGGVAADQRAAMNGRQRMETVGEGRQPGFVQPWQRQAQHAADRARAHGGQVGQVHGQRFMPQRTGIDVGKEMPPFQQQVGAGGDLLASRRGKQRAVVAHAQQAGGRRPREIARDQIEFGRHGDSAVRPLRTVVDFTLPPPRGPALPVRARASRGEAAGAAGRAAQRAPAAQPPGPRARARRPPACRARR